MTVRASRLPCPPSLEKTYNIDPLGWRALVEAIFPLATCAESVLLALSYCKARGLDVFKRPVHIVAIWDKNAGRMVDSVWPGIGELRTTAFRTGQYAGRDATACGPDVTMDLGGTEMTFPEWMQVTVRRRLGDQIASFAGPRVYWLETYATAKKDTDVPNEMWRNRPRGQLDKCAEAAALRMAFPEEVGNDMIPEEVQHDRDRTINSTATTHVGAEGMQALLSSPDEAAADDAGEVVAEQTPAKGKAKRSLSEVLADMRAAELPAALTKFRAEGMALAMNQDEKDQVEFAHDDRLREISEPK